jgi:transposase-like protein
VEVDGLQINFCKNPACKNFGVAALQNSPRVGGIRGPRHEYVKNTSLQNQLLDCLGCGERLPIKSNLAIREEVRRHIADGQVAPTPGCPNDQCSNHDIPLQIGKCKQHYQSFGTSHAGSSRYRCKNCGRTFTVARRSTIRQRESHKNRTLFSLLVNKMPMRRICEAAEVNPRTLYRRIDFFYNQCKAYCAHREAVLFDGSLKIKRLYLAVDRQEYMLNWSTQQDKRNVVVRAVASADDRTGYIFGMHADFDPAMDPETIEADAAALGDVALPHAYRKYARVWLNADYTDAVRSRYGKNAKAARAAKSLLNDIQKSYDEAALRPDIESASVHSFDSKLPAHGMQVHPEYTLYGHFFYLKQLLVGVEKIRFFLDQESGIRAACLAAFQEDVVMRRVDAFFVRINKDLTVNERRQSIADSRAEFEKARALHPGLKPSEVELLLIQERIKSMQAIGKWKDKWLAHPFPSMSEPEKQICYLTDMGDYKVDHLARLYSRASLHAIDRYFMQIRRRINLLERPISTSSAAGRVWYGYSPYNAEVVIKLLTIFRVFYNYVAAGEDGKTPAMRLGLAKAKIDIEDLLYFVAP